MVKAIFFDIDGTLIDMNTKKMTATMKETLHKLSEAGIKLVIATGRGPGFLPDLKGLPFDAFLTYNGGYCYSGDTVIYKNPISKSDALMIVSNAGKLNRPLSLATLYKHVENGTDADLTEYFGISKTKMIIKPAEFEKRLNNEEIFQIMLGMKKEEYSVITAGCENAKVAAWWERAGDIIPADAGKGTGVSKILEYFDIKPEEAVAFGDGSNDIEMFEAVGLSVAMGNASVDVKRKADDVCPPVSRDGIYHYCVEKGWIQRFTVYALV